MGTFERFPSLWVALAIAAGGMLGSVAKDLVADIAKLEVAHINLPVAVLIWVMIYPMMIQIDWTAIRQVGQRPQGLALTLVINWLIKPFTMAALGVLFFEHLYAPWIEPASASEYIAGMILLAMHLGHGAASWFQSLGWRHPKYPVDAIGRALTAILFIGYMLPPTAVLVGLIRLPGA